jgi:alpha-glucan phosphorylases
MQADFVFECSWEVCNKVGGIHTVVSTKAKTMVEKYNDNYIVLGPDIIKDKGAISEFEEDPYILKNLKGYIESKGLRIRIGRWRIQGEPIAILVDFTPFISEKDKILTDFWKQYNLDSITGGWDYIEPVLFGYACAKVIEGYYEYYLACTDKIITQWHEWMTASGLLYLKKNCPQIATVFTTHATVLGRCIAGNNLPLYSDLQHYDADNVANQFNVRAKYSMEKIAAYEADSFTTVSELTNKECKQFLHKAVDVVTPNGFEPTFVPEKEEFESKRLLARKKIIDIARGLTHQRISQDATLIINSGRYEFKNKGIDVFINSMGFLNKQNIDKDIVAVIAVPAANVDIYKSLIQAMQEENFDSPTPDQFLTHHLADPENDPILRAIKNNDLHNSPSDRVKIIFIPSYLNGDDYVVNLSYFDFLIGFDISVFPSYYEPWGYTPMESMAFHIPSITTTLAGFGLWIKDSIHSSKGALAVVQREDGQTEQTEQTIVQKIVESLALTPQETQSLKDEAFEISKTTLWQNLIQYYQQAYDIALQKADGRKDCYIQKQPMNEKLEMDTNWGIKPVWKKVLVDQVLPERLSFLVKLSQNLWWSWNNDAYDLFYSINPQRFDSFDRSPIHLLESLTKSEIDSLLHNQYFLDKMDSVAQRFETYMQEGQNNKQEAQIAYFSMEFGISDTLKIFSGGLGMLAGDYLKEASDSNHNIIGVGLLYRYGYFNQKITKQGEQISQMYPQKFSHLPMKAVRDSEGKWKKISVNFPGREVWAKIWRCDVGRVPLYLLDTDIEQNNEQDRLITAQLYGGDWEMRLKQEILLGIGGVRMLREFGQKPLIYHSNEGHSAFNSLERMRMLMQESKLSYSQAKEIVRSSTLFTTHTPVAAGHDAFSEDLMRIYFSHFSQILSLEWEDFMALGRMNKENTEEKFSMSVLAMNFSQEVNGVSKIHGRVTKEMFAPMYKGYFARELYIDYVTNGVHFPTWVDRRWRALYEKTFGKEFLSDQSNYKYWKKIYSVSDKDIWSVHQSAKESLVRFMFSRLQDELCQRAEDPNLFHKIKERFDPKALTIGFARRFATYKRACLLFTDLKRLEKIVNNPTRPVQFIFAGKAHPADKAGQNLIKRIIEISKMPQFIGKIIFIDNYDMFVAKYLVRGVDVWLNTPTRPLEASGTSGEKAAMNGVLNFSVLDGWWAEGYKEGAGWALDEKPLYINNDYQNIFDAQMIYELLELQIVPLYYKQDSEGISSDWVKGIKNTICQIAPHFTMKRQIDDYYTKFYSKLIDRSKLLQANEGKLAREYASWKHHIRRVFNNIEVVDFSFPDTNNKRAVMGKQMEGKITLHLGDIDSEQIGVEVVVVRKENDQINDYYDIIPMQETAFSHSRATYSLSYTPKQAGVYDWAIRIYPKHILMPHRQDFPLLKWI